MGLESITDSSIEDLIKMPKKVDNPNAKPVKKPGHTQLSYMVSGPDNQAFKLYRRQNDKPGMSDGFSCGLLCIWPNGEQFALVRYNGPHNHSNHLEKKQLGYVCHIHKATIRYIGKNLKPDGYAEVTDRYSSLDEAFVCLLSDYCISGFPGRTLRLPFD